MPKKDSGNWEQKIPAPNSAIGVITPICTKVHWGNDANRAPVGGNVRKRVKTNINKIETIMNNQFERLNKEWKLYLENSAEQMQEDIRNMLTGKIVRYKQGKVQQDIAALYFEYEYEYMNITFWAENKNEILLTDVTELPTIMRNNGKPNSNWKHFIPETIWKEVIESEDEFEGDEDEYYEARDEYTNKSTELFEKWFFDCWKAAIKGMENIPDAYFSIHDTNWRTDLKTGKEMSIAEISKRYK